MSEGQVLDITLAEGAEEIGLATIEIMPLASPVAKPGTPFAGRPGGYQVKAGVNLNLDVFGTPSKFHLGTDSRFDKRYEIMNYRVSTKVGASEVEINGTNATKEITMTYDVGDGKQTRHFGYDQLSSPGGWEALGLPGLSGLASFALPVSTSGSAGNATALRPVIHAYDDRLTLGEHRRHDRVLGAHHRRFVEVHPLSHELLGAEVVRAVDLHRHAELGEGVNVSVETAAPDHIASRWRHDGPAEPREQRPGEQE